MASLEEEASTSKLYYPIGNTPPTDVTMGCVVAKQCDILLLGCGDIRNVLYTCHTLLENGTLRSSYEWTPDRISFYLNDNENAVITRDHILFNIVKTMNPDDEADMKFLWSVWYDVLMSREHSDRLRGVMNNLKKHTSGEQDIYFGNEYTEQSVKNCLLSWTQDQHGAKDSKMIQKRRHFLKVKYSEESEDLPTQRVASRLLKQFHCFDEEKLKDRYTQEVQEYTDVGTTRINAANMSQKQIVSTFSVNLTFFPPDYKDWAVPDDSSPFMCYDVERDLERYDGAKLTMAKICFEQLCQWVKSFHAAEKRCKIQIHLWLSDANTLCQQTLPKDLCFDFIDTSNLTDDLGLIPILVFCHDKLKEDGVMRTETFDCYKCLSHGEHFLRLCIDIPYLMYPTVLGFHLAEELKLGCEWKKAASFTPCTLTGSDAISSCLEQIQSPKPLQSRETFHKFTPALFDVKTKNKIINRLKEMTIEQATVSHSESREHHGNDDIPVTSLCFTVVEYLNWYEVMIPVPELEIRGELTVKHGDDKRIVNLQLATDKTTHFSATVRFSCPVSVEDNTVTYSKKKGLISGSLLRCQRLSVGECVLPWKVLTTSDVSKLPDYPTSNFSLTALNRQIGWVFPTSEHAHSGEVNKPNPRHQLQDILGYLLADAPIKKKTRLVTIPRKNPEGHLPLDMHQSFIILEDHKLWEGKVATFVTVYKHDVASSLVRQGKLTLHEFMVDVGNVSGAQNLNMELQQGYDILAEILEVNSYRRQQDSAKGKWKMRSFIRPRFPFLPGEAHFMDSDMIVKYTEGGMWKDPSAPFRLMQELLQFPPELMFSPEARKVAEAVNTYKPICDFCGKMTDCKQCTACNEVFYCSRDCQRRAWPHHKQRCRKYRL